MATLRRRAATPDRRAGWRVSQRSAGAVMAALMVGLVLATAITAEAAAPATSTADVTEQVLRVPVRAEADGKPVALDVTVYTERGASGRRPAVVLAHGFGGSKADLVGWGRALARSGYVALTYTARGFARSGGLIHLDSVDFEAADASRLLDALAARPDVQLDRPGDPRVGVAGSSYGGALALLVAGTDRRVDAVVSAITWNDLGQALLPQSAQGAGGGDTPASSPPDGVPGVFKQRWSALLFSAGSSSTGAGGVCGRFAPDVCAAYTAAASTGRPDPALLALLARSSPARVLSEVRAPTLLVQGEQDALFGLDQADANARGVAATGTPVAVRWVTGGHDAGASDAGNLGDLQGHGRTWFGRYLQRDGSAPDTSFSYAVPPASTLGGELPEQRVAPGYPGLAGRPAAVRRSVPLTGQAQSVVSPPGGSPASVTGLPGTGGLLSAAGATGALRPLGVLAGQSAVFSSAASTTGLTVVGSSRVRLSVISSTTDATLFVGLWDAAPGGGAVLPEQLVAPVRIQGLSPGRPREVDVALPGVVRTVVAGHRLQVVVSSTDQAYAVPRDPRIYQVALVGGAVAVPTVAGVLDTSGSTLAPRGLLVGVGVLLLALVALLLLRRRGRRRVHREESLAEVPMVVQGLVKTYADGMRAVDDVSWRAEPGQVVGLLGPNGAGKTTTLRMVVGLVRPDAGSVHVLGWPVTAGASVLGDVGVFIEGPGFLPHLTGAQNLRAYWAATGRPAAEAHLEEALEIAGLGAAVDRRTRAYSQGMRQRLGIAQAMLGLPRLLLLDEPTNGLDPPQILAMRQVLRDYAATGRTVVVSSHLLGEVEQTCTHVVVMHHGRVVTTGSVESLTGGAGGRHLEDVFMQLVAGVA